ncbi:hypothetical protein [Janthinobacterium sp. ROICE36]|uniref:hypothetical protein n=1 Tax=Janthinobacterium sp. ROICE36 TaxID=2048670 RepID=UPI0015E1521D|nr:hypothetical protein [Janthinobacterium sp. ROICE36]
MNAIAILKRLRLRRTPGEMAAIIADTAPTEPPTRQEVIDQLDADVVRQFQRMLDVEGD